MIHVDDGGCGGCVCGDGGGGGGGGCCGGGKIGCDYDGGMVTGILAEILKL